MHVFCRKAILADLRFKDCQKRIPESSLNFLQFSVVALKINQNGVLYFEKSRSFSYIFLLDLIIIRYFKNNRYQ